MPAIVFGNKSVVISQVRCETIEISLEGKTQEEINAEIEAALKEIKNAKT